MKYLVLALSSLFLISCQKQNDVKSSGEKKTTDDVHYYYNGVETDVSNLNFTDPNQYYFFQFGEAGDTSSERKEIHVFTDSLAYIDYCNTNGYTNLIISEEITRHLKEYAIQTGVEAEANALGAIPEWWTEYEQTYTTSVLEANSITPNSSLGTFLRKNCYSGPSALIGNLVGAPWLGLYNLKEDVESFIPYAGFSIHKNYENPFYRDLNWTMQGVVGYKNIPLCEFPYPINHWLSNKGNSWWWFGI